MTLVIDVGNTNNLPADICRKDNTNRPPWRFNAIERTSLSYLLLGGEILALAKAQNIFLPEATGNARCYPLI